MSELEQIDQIESELVEEDQIDSEISEVDQINSELRDVVLIRVGYYDGEITVADWYQQGQYYYYEVSHLAHLLANPCVDEMLVAGDDGLENSLFSYTRLPNNDIRFRSSYAVNSTYRIKGEK